MPVTAGKTDPASDWERAVLDDQLECLGRLAEIGLSLAGVIRRRGTAAGTEAALDQAAAAFALVEREVRLTLALQSRLIADFKNRARSGATSQTKTASAVDLGRVEPRVRASRTQKNSPGSFTRLH